MTDHKQITIKVSNEAIANGLSCAFSGGSRYWMPQYAAASWKGFDEHEAGYYDANHRTLSITLTHDTENVEEGTYEGRFKVTHAAITKGLTLMADGSPKAFGDLLSVDNADAWTGDTLLQYIVFGKLVFG